MSKRVLILLAVGIVAIVAAFLFMKYEMTDKNPEEDLNADPEEDLQEDPEDEPGTDRSITDTMILGDPNRFKKGYKYDRALRKWVPVVPEQESEAEINKTLTDAGE